MTIQERMLMAALAIGVGLVAIGLVGILHPGFRKIVEDWRQYIPHTSWTINSKRRGRSTQSRARKGPRS